MGVCNFHKLSNKIKICKLPIQNNPIFLKCAEILWLHQLPKGQLPLLLPSFVIVSYSLCYFCVILAKCWEHKSVVILILVAMNNFYSSYMKNTYFEGVNCSSWTFTNSEIGSSEQQEKTVRCISCKGSILFSHYFRPQNEYRN